METLKFSTMNAIKSFRIFSLIVLTFLFTAVGMQAQVINILMNDGDVVACDDANAIYAFFDDGEQQPYSTPTDGTYELTICPDDPGDALIVEFYAFSIFQSAVQGQSDYLTIYNGSSTSAQSLGSYTGDDLQGLTISASSNNPDGCLTFVFSVNTGSGGAFTLNGWEAAVTCGTPCETPISDAALVSNYEIIDNVPVVKICVGDEVIFDDEGSFLPSGLFPIENYIWNFDDGTIDTLSSPYQISHTFNEPGSYTVGLSVGYFNGTNDCISLNLEPMVVWVSTPAIFNTEVLSPLCVGVNSTATIEVDATPLTSDLWSDAPTFDAPNIAATGFGAGSTYTSEITFDFFEPDAEIEDCDDIISIAASLEHSYLGDLEIFIECPNGTQVMLQDQAGGATFLGEPVDVEGDFAEGTCYDYGWEEGSTLGLFNEGETTQTNYTDTQGNVSTGNILNPGLYEPFESICGLVGCPLNGTWQLGFTDWLGLDNGFMCTWNLNLDPSLLPGVTIIQPQIVEIIWDFDLVSSTDLIITQDLDNSALLDIVALTPGVYNIGLEAINDFGCSADTVFQIVVFDELDIDAGLDQIFCGNTVELTGTVVDDPGANSCSIDAGNFNYCYADSDNTTFTYCPDNIGDGTKMVVAFSAGEIDGSDALMIYDGADASAPLIESFSGDLTGMTWTATNPDGCITIVFTSDWWTSCQGSGLEEAAWCVSCLGGADCAFNYEWVPDFGLDDPFSATPTVTDFGGLATTYTLLVYPDGYPGCVGSDQVDVIPGFDYTVDSDDPSCLLNDGFVSVNIMEPPSAGPWTLNFSSGGSLIESVNSFGGIDVFDNLVAGNYMLEVSDTGGCLYAMEIIMNAPIPMDFDLTLNPTICINGAANLGVSSEMDPGNSWVYLWDNGLGTGYSQVVTPVSDTDYEVFATAPNGCTSVPQTVTVQVYDSLSVMLDAPNLICGGSFAELEAVDFAGGSGAGYNFNWTWQSIPVGSNDYEIVDYPSATGSYCLTLTDNCETPAITECQEVVIETPIPAAFNSDTTRACVPGVFQFESLVDPDLISQTEWFFGDGQLSYLEDPVHEYPTPGGYDVTFNITSLIGCEYTNFQPGYLQVYARPYVGYTASPQPTRAPDTQIEFESVNSANVVDWYWMFDGSQNLGTSDVSDPIFVFPIDVGGTYPVTLVVTDENGCSSQVTRIIDIMDIFALYIPTSFTPNNDGVNDAFFVEGSDIDPDRFTMQILNRWGNMVFETHDLHEPWYGPAEGDSDYYAQDGVYFYRVVVYNKSSTAERKEVTGTVLVIR